MKRAISFIAVALGLLLLADFGLRAAAENAAATFIDKKIEQRVEPSVGLGGFPFLWSVVTGRFDEVTVEMPRVVEGPLVIENVRLTFDQVRLEALEVLGGRGDLKARELDGRGVISEAAINDVVSRQVPGVTVAVEDGRVSLSRAGVEVAATAVVANDSILINAGDVAGPLEIPLPRLLEDVRFSSLRAERGQLVLGIRASRVRIRA